MVYGAWASLHHPEDPVDASWERNKKLVLEAEALGFDSTLIAQHIINPFGEEYDQLETWTTAAALASLTERIEIIAAIKPYLVHPVVLAKQALQIETISRGRFALNFVNAWFKPEFEKAGITFADHDERYAYGKEWIAIVRELVSGRPVNFAGKYFNIKDYQLRPKDPYRERPTVYAGGESEPARDLATSSADVYFINGQPLFEVQRLIEDVKRRPRTGSELRFGLSAFVIARETDEEAQQALDEAWKLSEKDKDNRAKIFGNADPKTVMFHTAIKYPHIGTNGGTAAGLVGSYETVTQRIWEFADAGIDLFMLQFQPFESEMRRFAEEVIPRVRAAAEGRIPASFIQQVADRQRATDGVTPP